jgi:hypothetical protein
MTMVLWAIILGGALGGGLLVLHGFGKSKAASPQMLTAYQQMLKMVAERKKFRRGDQADVSEGEGDLDVATGDVNDD